MCGVIGYQPGLDQTIDEQREAKLAFGALFQESTIRGQHYYGIAQPGQPQPDGYSGGFSVCRSQYRSGIPECFTPNKPAVAHTRFSQSGDWRVPQNNQPLIVGTRALAMNGVIHMGTKPEFEKDFDVQCSVDNDAEIFLRYLEKDGVGPLMFIDKIAGSFAGVWLENYDDGTILYAARNPRRPLWKSTQYGAVWIASTLDIFVRAGFTEATVPLLPGIVYGEPAYGGLQ